MTVYLLDTSIIIDVLNAKLGRVDLLRELLQEGHLLACCAVTVTEVYAGMRSHEKSATDKLLSSLEYYGVTREIAAQAGLIKRDFAYKGVTLSVSDVTIAAVALTHGLTLITDNIKHYPMPELRLYPQPR
jgi:predicted nucleic acid-binding protein